MEKMPRWIIITKIFDDLHADFHEIASKELGIAS